MRHRGQALRDTELNSFSGCGTPGSMVRHRGQALRDTELIVFLGVVHLEAG